MCLNFAVKYQIVSEPYEFEAFFKIIFKKLFLDGKIELLILKMRGRDLR